MSELSQLILDMQQWQAHAHSVKEAATRREISRSAASYSQLAKTLGENDPVAIAARRHLIAEALDGETQRLASENEKLEAELRALQGR
jgi:hypothetical protein